MSRRRRQNHQYRIKVEQQMFAEAGILHFFGHAYITDISCYVYCQFWNCDASQDIIHVSAASSLRSADVETKPNLLAVLDPLQSKYQQFMLAPLSWDLHTVINNQFRIMKIT